MDRKFQAIQWRETMIKTNEVVLYDICNHLLLLGVAQSASKYLLLYSKCLKPKKVWKTSLSTETLDCGRQ